MNNGQKNLLQFLLGAMARSASPRLRRVNFGALPQSLPLRQAQGKL